MSLRVVESFGAVLQDLGRTGHEQGGINRSGASDTFSSRFANLVVGNDPGTVCVEVTGTGFTVELLEPLVLAVTGAVATVWLDGDVRLPQWEPLTLPAGTHLRVDPPTAGYRTYLAVAGGVRADRLFDSASPLPAFGFGNPVSTGDVLVAGTPRAPLSRGTAALASGFVGRLRGEHRIGALETAQTAMFSDMDRLWQNTFVMSGRSNAVGARFTGDTPTRSDHRELVSRSVPIGSIEIPSQGELIALLRGRLITAGYPVPAVIAKADLDVTAQLAPGDEVTVARIAEQEARYRLMDVELVLHRLASARTGVLT